MAERTVPTSKTISAEQAGKLYQNSTAQNQNMAKLYQGQQSKPSSTPTAPTNHPTGPSAAEQQKMAEEQAKAAKRKSDLDNAQSKYDSGDYQGCISICSQYSGDKDFDNLKAQAEQALQRQGQWQGAMNRIQNSAAIADEGTIKEGINESDAGKYIGTGMGKSRMANASEANTAYELSDYINKNKQMNRAQGLSQAVTNAEDLLKAFGFEDTALSNKEAGDLQNQAQGELDFANTLSTIMQTAHDYLGKIK